MAKPFAKLGLRLMTAVIFLPIIAYVLWTPPLHPIFGIFICVLVGVGAFEYYAMVRKRRITPESIGGIVAAVLVCLSGYTGDVHLTNLAMFGGCLLLAILHIVRGHHSLIGLSTSLFGVFYVGWFGAHALLILRATDLGPELITMLFLVVMLTDSMAYLIGSLIGKHPLAPKVSPAKTWEGSAAGMAGALLGMLGYYYASKRLGWYELPGWDVWRYLAGGLLLSVVAQVGDLLESVLKRDAGVKDSGGFFPGHGGVLDRCDGFLFATPILYYIYVPLLGG